MTASVSATYPHQVIEVAAGDEALADKMWNSLEDFVTEGENILPMIDTSGSMFGGPLEIAISLGMYLAEKNKSEFQDTFLTFSESPELVRLEGGTIAERMRNIEQANWGMNTDFTKAYDLILQSANLAFALLTNFSFVNSITLKCSIFITALFCVYCNNN